VDPESGLLFGRDRELGRVELCLEEMASGPTWLALVGEAGMGKTTVWRAGIRSALARGYRVLIGGPVEAEAALSYAGLADLLAGVEEDVFAALPDPQRRAIDVALLRAEPEGRAPEPRAVFMAFTTVLRLLAERTPVVVAVDDLQWLDGPSARALNYAVRRASDLPVGILAAVRVQEDPASNEPGRGLLERFVRLGIEPLDAASLHRLFEARLGASFPRPTLLRLHRACNGNPFFGLEIAQALVVHGMAETGVAWPIPDDLRELVDARLRKLPAWVRDALLAASAVSDPATELLGGSALGVAEAAGIVTVGPGGRVRFSHPLYASAIYLASAPAERRAVHRRLATRQTDIEERARHLALATEHADADVAALLDRAASRARSRGAPDAAAELAERALALTPEGHPGEAARRALYAAESHFRAGDLSHARSLLSELIGKFEQGSAQAFPLRLLGEISHYEGALDDAARYLQASINAAGDDPALVAPAELDVSFLLFQSFGDFEAAGAAVARALYAAEQLGDDALLALALASSTITDFLLGHGLDEQKLERALELEAPEKSLPTEMRPSLIAGILMFLIGRFDRARALFTALRTRLVEQGEDSDLPMVLTWLARLECSAGNLYAATALADEALERAQQLGSDSLAAVALADRALVDSHAGRVEAARTAAQGALQKATSSGWQIAAFWAATAIGFLELSLGDEAEATATFGFSTRLVEERGLIEPSRAPFLADAIESLIAVGELDRADGLTATLEEQGEALDRPWAILAAGRCRALVLAARGDIASALWAVEQALLQEDRVPMPLEIARTLIVRGRLEGQSNRKQQARRTLERALGICEEIGARLWTERAQAELATLGYSAT
jgi:tetratricopeptide (TPR) repeat protein